MNSKSSIDYSLVSTGELNKGLAANHMYLAFSFLLKPTTDELDTQMNRGLYHSMMSTEVPTKRLFENHGIYELGLSTFHTLVSDWLKDHNIRETLTLLKQSYPEIEPPHLYELLIRYLAELDGADFGHEEGEQTDWRRWWS